MRKTEALGRMGQTSSRALMRCARISAVALGIGLLIASGAARAQDDEDDDKTFEEKIIEGVMHGIGATNMENSGIDYRERSPLVVPPKLDLPPPVAAKQEANVPNWPKDPDEKRRKALAEKRKKDKKDTRDAVAVQRDQTRPLSPSELNVARTVPTDGAGNHDSDSEAPGTTNSNPLSPDQLGFSGRFSSLFGGSKTEQAEFKGEPTRDTLTQPPPGYQTPSPNFAYGTGKKMESLNKEYNPAAGKYGDTQ
ncbi:hypothetical protein [Bradyrhizobium sp. Tv2a-2]|uniref:hypothetical protein n=1 Tax=Bradyrhizobium sp. Tv2a-2 TaxID=113395 RepID=UPI000419C34B|nr:hypothetical protein [Bradyrhizobium sp. Tv2a-2]